MDGGGGHDDSVKILESGGRSQEEGARKKDGAGRAACLAALSNAVADKRRKAAPRLRQSLACSDTQHGPRSRPADEFVEPPISIWTTTSVTLQSDNQQSPSR